MSPETYVQANEFTLVHVNKFIPALPPCATPSDCTMAANSCGKGQCLVAVPYSFDSTPWANIPALATDRYVFWVTNPSMAMYWAFNQWCRGLIGALAFEAESSYNSIQIWRMDPYEFCPVDANGVRRCPEDSSATFKTLPGFVSGSHSANVCNQTFLVVAPAITYINEYNLALTVLNTTFANVDTTTLRPVDDKLARSLLLVLANPDHAGLGILIHPCRVEHVVLFALHPKVRENARVDPVEALDGVETARSEGLDFPAALLKLLLITLVRGRNGEERVAVRFDLRVGETALGSQRLEIFGHMARDELALCLGEDQFLLAREGAPERAKLSGKGHWRLFAKGFFYCFFSTTKSAQARM